MTRVASTLPSLLVLGACVGLVACDGDAVPRCNDVAGGDGEVVVTDPRAAYDQVPGCPHGDPRVIDCSLAFDDVDTYTVRLEDGAPRTESHRGLHLSLSWNEADYDSDSFSILAYIDDTNVGTALYQVSDCGPLNQFHGMHGFTGLLSYRHPTDPDTKVQLACFVRSADDPMTGWDTEGI